MASETYFKESYTVAGSPTWTPIRAPIDCDYVDFRNVGASDAIGAHEAAIAVRSDPANALTEDAIGTGVQDTITAPFRPDAARLTRFQARELVLYAQSENAFSQTLVVTWIR